MQNSQKPTFKHQKIAIIIFGIIFSVLILSAIIFYLVQQFTTQPEDTITPGTASVEQGNKERKTWPIIANLPIKNTLYTLGYTIKDDNLTLIVDATEGSLESALKKLASLDASRPLSDYNVEVRKPENPFSGFHQNSETDPLEFIKTGYKHIDKEFSVISAEEKNGLSYVNITTGSSEHYNLIHYTAVIRKSGSGWELMKPPVPTLLVSQ